MGRNYDWEQGEIEKGSFPNHLIPLFYYDDDTSLHFIVDTTVVQGFKKL